MWTGVVAAALLATVAVPTAFLMNASANARGVWAYRLLGMAGGLWFFAGVGVIAILIDAGTQ